MISSELLNCAFMLSLFIIKIEAFTEELPMNFIPFEQWVDKSNNYQLQKFTPSLPQYVIVTDTTLEDCKSKSSCQILLNELLSSQRISKNKIELSNFYINGNGDIFTGLGWNSQVNNSIYCNNKPFIEITFIANAGQSILKNTQLRVAQRILEHGLINNFLSESYVLFGAWQLHEQKIKWARINQYLISTWPHWTSLKIDNQCKFTF